MSRRLRVGLVIPTLDRGGAEKQFCLLASRLDRNRFDPHVFVLTRSGPRQSFLEDAGVPVTVIGKRWKGDPSAWWKLAAALGRQRLDLVHTWLFAANSFGRTAALWAKIPIVIGGERSVDPWKSSWQLTLDRWLSRRSDAIFTNSSGVADFYQTRGIDKERFLIIPNGVELPGPRKIDRPEALRRMQVPSDWRVILAVGRLWPQKGYREALWCMELLRLVEPRTMLVVIGEGPQRASLEEYRDQIQVAAHVRLLGERSDVGDLLPHADVLINTSLYEGQSNSMLEAMANGVPVVASDIPGNRDLVIDQKTGYLVDREDVRTMVQRLRRLVTDSPLRHAMGQAARDRVESEFSVDRMVTRHEEAYLRLARKRSIPGID
jgi:glycosyltransferase involved in cell wall biosynthesis